MQIFLVVAAVLALVFSAPGAHAFTAMNPGKIVGAQRQLGRLKYVVEMGRGPGRDDGRMNGCAEEDGFLTEDPWILVLRSVLHEPERAGEAQAKPSSKSMWAGMTWNKKTQKWEQARGAAPSTADAAADKSMWAGMTWNAATERWESASAAGDAKDGKYSMFVPLRKPADN